MRNGPEIEGFVKTLGEKGVSGGGNIVGEDEEITGETATAAVVGEKGAADEEKSTDKSER